MLISANTFITLDGVMQAPGGPEEDTSRGFAQGGWLVPFGEQDWGHVVDGWFKKAAALLLGRNTFESMRSYWPQVTDPDNSVATVLNTAHKYVVSTSLSEEETAWGETTVIGDNILDAIRDLKRRDGGELQIHGSWHLVHTLHEAGLVDVFRILQFPVIVGSGKRLWQDAVPASLQVRHAEMLEGGIVSYELHLTEFGSIASGEYAVVDGREAVIDPA